MIRSRPNRIFKPCREPARGRARRCVRPRWSPPQRCRRDRRRTPGRRTPARRTVRRPLGGRSACPRIWALTMPAFAPARGASSGSTPAPFWIRCSRSACPRILRITLPALAPASRASSGNEPAPFWIRCSRPLYPAAPGAGREARGAPGFWSNRRGRKNCSAPLRSGGSSAPGPPA